MNNPGIHTINNPGNDLCMPTIIQHIPLMANRMNPKRFLFPSIHPPTNSHTPAIMLSIIMLLSRLLSPC